MKFYKILKLIAGMALFIILILLIWPMIDNSILKYKVSNLECGPDEYATYGMLRQPICCPNGALCD